MFSRDCGVISQPVVCSDGIFRKAVDDNQPPVSIYLRASWLALTAPSALGLGRLPGFVDERFVLIVTPLADTVASTSC